MKAKPLPSQKYLEECFEYFPDTGLLFWKERPTGHFKNERVWKIWNTRFSGKEAFTSIDNKGYKYGCLDWNKWRAHRIIYKLVYGIDPEYIDHEMGNRADNRIDKIENVSETDNNRNQKMPTTNKSGVIGVYWHTPLCKWRAQIKSNNKSRHLGYFNDLEEAAKARKAAEVELGYHPNHGRHLQTVTKKTVEILEN